ncbi:MAG: hypothetical protein KC416_02410 [Myxococcales bacterium]|nr:hypothetical protein [Myxococcales bacterium]
MASEPLQHLLERGRDISGKMVEPAVPALDAVEEGMAQALAADSQGTWDTESWRRIGFEPYRVADRADIVALVDQQERGAGLYFLRVENHRPVFVHIPHSFSDLDTLPIGVALFDGLRARMLLVNSVHRRRGGPCEEGECASDVAHGEGTFFHAVHRGAMGAHPQAVVVAVHGFRELDSDPDVIVSAAGTTADAQGIARTLQAWIADYDVGTFPVDIGRLGGRSGIQARHLRASGGRMIHLELSRAIRRALLRDFDLRRRFVLALARAISEMP